MDEDDDGDVDPRTLAAAVARLAHMTSDTPVGSSFCYSCTSAVHAHFLFRAHMLFMHIFYACT